MLSKADTAMVQALFRKGDTTARKIANKLKLPLDDVKLAIEILEATNAPAPAEVQQAPEIDTEELVFEPIALDRLDGEQIKQRIEAMYGDALEVVAMAMRSPKAVTQVQWNATQWVLNKAAAIQEMARDKDGERVVNQLNVGEKTAAALERMMDDLTGGDWKTKLEDSLADMPDTQ